MRQLRTLLLFALAFALPVAAIFAVTAPRQGAPTGSALLRVEGGQAWPEEAMLSDRDEIFLRRLSGAVSGGEADADASDGGAPGL